MSLINLRFDYYYHLNNNHKSIDLMNQVDRSQVFGGLIHAKNLYQMHLNMVQILMLSYLQINFNYINFHHIINHKKKTNK